MKKTIYLLLIPVFLGNCKKESKSLEVSTVSATVQDDGSVLLRGRLNSDGGLSGVGVGFGYGTSIVPTDSETFIKDLKLTDKSFTATVNNLNESKKYYFRAFAGNGSQLVFGKIIELENIKAKPVIAPCTPELNTVNHGDGNPTAPLLRISANTSPIAWTTHFTDGNGYNYKISFEKKPSTGIYTTIKDFIPKGTQVYVLINDGSDHIVEKDYKVYVNKIATNKWDITICEAPFFMFFDCKLTIRFQVVN